MLIEIEGIDGTGKTTQCQMLRSWFESQGERAVIVKDLESTSFGRHIRSMLITDTPRSKETELFAFLACKSQLFSEIVIGELSQGSHIICDRGMGSLFSYFESHGLNRDVLATLLAIAVPDSLTINTVLIDLDVQVALARNSNKPSQSKFDNMGLNFFSKQRQVYLDLAKTNNWTVIDGSAGTKTVHSAITKAVRAFETQIAT